MRDELIFSHSDRKNIPESPMVFSKKNMKKKIFFYYKVICMFNEMRVELNFPIYKINHVYMHYFKNATVTLQKESDFSELQYSNFPILITQDITKFVKMENEVLSKDWESFENIMQDSNSIIRKDEQLSDDSFSSCKS